MIIPILDRTHFNFSYLGAAENEIVVLASALPVAGATSAVLVVRIHENQLGSDAFFIFSCIQTAPSGDDPAEFNGASEITSYVGTQAAPYYLATTLSTPPSAGWWKVTLMAKQAESPVTVAAQLSAFLVLRHG